MTGRETETRPQVASNDAWAAKRQRRLIAGAGVAPRQVTSIREAKRDANRNLSGLLVDRRCECARRDCEGRFPAAAELHRRHTERFIVVPAHRADDLVVAAADRYFVVAPARLPGATLRRSDTTWPPFRA